MSRRADHISDKRRAWTQILAGIESLEALDKEGAAMVRRGEPLTDTDFTGENAQLHTRDAEGNPTGVGAAAKFAAATAAVSGIISAIPDQVRDAVQAVRL